MIAVGIFVAMAGGYIVYQIIGERGAENLKTAFLRVGNVALEVEIADDAVSRARGLSGRADLEKGRGMLFIFPDARIQHFWMKGMNFPIDIIWIRGGKIAGAEEGVHPSSGLATPPIYQSPLPVEMVLEVAAGEFNRLNLRPGDSALFVE